uniref:Endonuclease:exonuclease:phosphatase family n=1 Tax=Echinococcus granulosus TaxID=6210 RepID=A0A068WMB2_ECHGR|nr:endonuclease:exonuclease:phosphatase family [Echinococcus granulosus]
MHKRPSDLTDPDRKKDVLKFFKVASESEIINRYPSFGETLAHNIILKRQNAPLKRLRDIWNLGAVREVLLSDCGMVIDDNIKDEQVINEQLPQPRSVSANTRPIPVATHYPSAPPLPQLPPADHDVIELFRTLKDMGLVERWTKYISDSDILTTNDALPSNTYRLATWNLDRFTLAKARHSGFREAICLTILSNQFDLIAFQEVVEPESVQLLVNELNDPVLPMIRGWIAVNQAKYGSYKAFSSSDKTGRTFQAVEYSSILYRSDRVQAISSRVLSASGKFSRLPFLSKFKLGSSTLMLTSVHLRAPGLEDTHLEKNAEEVACLADFVDAIMDTLSDKIYYVILGDFNMDPGNKAFDALRSRGLVSTLPTACATMASAVERGAGIGQRQGDSRVPCLDNAWLCPNLLASEVDEGSGGLKFTGVSAVVIPSRHPLIPLPDFSDGCGRPSNHCPVYFDLASYSVTHSTPPH